MSEASRAFVEAIVAEHIAGRRPLTGTIDAIRAIQERGVRRTGPATSPAPAEGSAHRPPRRATRSRQYNQQKGRRLQLLAKAFYADQGYHVEVAHNKVLWIPDKATGKRRPISLSHDYFGCWDLMVCSAGARFFVQVCTLSDSSTRRNKILASRFPCTERDAILAHERGRVFRLLRGPLFALGQERVKVGK